MSKFSVRRETFGKITLLVLILIAAALRFYRVDAQDIWGDEAFSIFLSQQPLPAVISGAADTHPPFYPLLLFIWLKLAGTGAFATRALSVLVGILVVPLIFVFAKQLAPSRPRVAWFAAILATVSPLLVYYSQETRMYELVTLLALASMYCLTLLPQPPLPSPSELGQEKGKGAKGVRGEVVAYFLSTALALYTHYSALFVWFAENLFVAIRFRRTRTALAQWVLLQLALIAAYVPWIVVQSSFLRGKASTRFDEWGWRGIEMVVGKTILAFSVGLTVDFPIAQIATMAFLILVALGVYGIIHARNSILWLAPMYFVVPVFVAWLVNPWMPFFFERYVLVALPGFYVTIALGQDYLAQHASRARAATGAIGMGVLISAFALSSYFFNDAYAKGKYGQMMAYVASHAQPGDALILNNPLQKPLFDYYRPRGVPAFYLPDGAPLEDPRTRQQLADIARDHSRLWLVMFGNPAEYDPTGYLERWLGAHAFKSFSRGFVDARLGLYVMPSAPAAIQRPLRATLGENIRLIGYDLDRAEIRPGQTLQLTLHWQATTQIVKSYTVFTHLIGATNPATQSPVWAQMDGEPVGGSRPTTGWQIGETIDDRYGLLIPPNIPPGDYTLEVGMYDPVTLARLPVRDENGNRVADDRVVLGTVSVNAR